MGASAIRAAHHEAGLPDPTADPTVRRALKGIRRQHAENGVGTRQAKPPSAA